MALYRPIHKRFVRYCQARAYGHYDPEDLVNETVLKAYEKFDEVKQPEAFLYYLFSIAKNILRNNARRQKFHGDFEEEQAANLVGGENQGEANLEAEMLYKALDQLPEEQREAVILFDLSGFSVKEVMELQNAGSSAVKTRLSRGRKRLAELLKEPVITNNNR